MTRPLARIERVERAIAFLFRVAIGIAFAALIAAVSVQVVGRSLADSPVWTEEATRFALLWLAALGAGLSYRSGDLVDVDLVREALPGRWPRRLRALGAIVTLGLAAVLLPAAWLYTSIGARQTSPALGWRMDFVHASVLVLLASLGLFALLRLLVLACGGEASEGPLDALRADGPGDVPGIDEPDDGYPPR